MEVTSQGSRYINEKVEDVGFVGLRFDHDQMAHIHVSWMDPSKVRKVTVVESKWMIV